MATRVSIGPPKSKTDLWPPVACFPPTVLQGFLSFFSSSFLSLLEAYPTMPSTKRANNNEATKHLLTNSDEKPAHSSTASPGSWWRVKRNVDGYNNNNNSNNDNSKNKIQSVINVKLNHSFHQYKIAAKLQKITAIDALDAHRVFNIKRTEIENFFLSFNKCSNSVCSLLDSKTILNSAYKKLLSSKLSEFLFKHRFLTLL